MEEQRELDMSESPMRVISFTDSWPHSDDIAARVVGGDFHQWKGQGITTKETEQHVYCRGSVRGRSLCEQSFPIAFGRRSSLTRHWQYLGN